MPFLRLRNLSILRSTYSVGRFFDAFSFEILRPRPKYGFSSNISGRNQNAAKLRGSTGGNIRTSIVAVRVRRSDKLEVFSGSPSEYASTKIKPWNL